MTAEPKPPATRIRRDSDLLRLLSGLAEMAEQLSSISNGWIAAREVRRRSVAAAPALRANAGGGGGAPTGSHSDPTLTAVMATSDARDRLDLELAKELAALEQAHVLVRTVATRVLIALAPRPAHPRPTQQARRRCESCARADLDVDIDIDRYAKYCRFCGEFKGAEGRVPPKAACEWRARHGKNPSRTQIVRWILEEAMPTDRRARSRSGQRA